MMKITNIKMQNAKRFTLIVLVAAFTTFTGCTNKNQPIDADKSIVIDEADVKKITLSSSQFKSAEMVLGKISEQNFYHSIKAKGTIDVPPENRASVSIYFGGYVKDIHLLPGEQIKKGQLLFTLENPDYIQIQQEFMEAEGQLKYLKADYERQKQLIEENITSQKNYLKAESDYKVTFSKYQSLKKKLELMNIDINTLLNGNLVSTIKILSPISGSITSVNAVKGLFLSPNDIAINITNTDHMHVELKVFESELSFIKKGQPILFTQPNNPDQKHSGEVYLINHFVESESRTAMVHGHIMDEEKAQIFAPGMYIEAEILTENKSLPALPEQAIVNIDETDFVLVRDKANADKLIFTKVKVEVGEAQNGYIPVLNYKDFNVDSEFLTKGAFNLIGE